MRAPCFIAGVITQFQKFLDIGMPGFDIDAGRAFALAALIDRGNRCIDVLTRHQAVDKPLVERISEPRNGMRENANRCRRKISTAVQHRRNAGNRTQ